MTIGICDDERDAIEEIICICKNTLKKDYCFKTFDNGRAVLNHPDEIELLILDIEMPGVNGIEVKEFFMEQERDTLMIFVTNYPDFIQEAFGVTVMGFVEKDEMQTALPFLLEKAEKMINRYIILDKGIDSRVIMYIQSQHNYGELIMCDGNRKLIRKSLRECEEELIKVDFVRVHRRYLVNMRWIDKINKDSVLVGDTVLPVSVRSRKDVKHSYLKFCFIHARYY